MSLPGKIRKISDYLASTECAVTLFLGIAAVAVPGTFSTRSGLYKSPFFLALLALFSLNLVLCTVKRFRAISWPVLVLHGGVVVTLAGCILTATGFVATVNVYEQMAADRFFRWDTEQDADLGFSMAVKKINMAYAPAPVRVGVLKNGVKDTLHELKTGESFDLPPYRITAESLDIPTQDLRLTVHEQGHLVGSCLTSGPADVPAGFPYQFKLVAFQTPRLLRQWVELVLLRGENVIAEGSSEVNHPFQWGGLYFYNTQVAWDQQGRPYAGIQVVSDPGRLLVFAGFTIIGLGALLAGQRRFFRKRKTESVPAA